jgi:hypothetical protein
MYAIQPSVRRAFLPLRTLHNKTRSVLKHFACVTLRGLSLENRHNLQTVLEYGKAAGLLKGTYIMQQNLLSEGTQPAAGWLAG